MKKILPTLIIALSAVILYNQYSKSSCQSNQDQQVQSCKSPIAVYEDPSRIPLRNFVLEQLGDMNGKTIADIGAGPGFFAFEMAKEAKKVYATEIDPMFLNYMKNKRSELKINNFEVVEANEDYSELQNLNVDYALLVFVFHYLDDPKEFLKRLRKSIDPDGKLFIVNAQLSPVIIKDYLEMSGFTDITETEFSYSQEECGEQKVQLISSKVSNPFIVELK